MSHELLNHPDVLKTIRAELLRGGYPKEEVDDGVRDVVAELFEYLETAKEKVETPDRMKAIARQPSYLRGIDALRAKQTKAQAIAGPTDQADTYVAPASSHDDRIDMRRALATMKEHATDDEGALLAGLGAGVSQKQLAEELKVSHAQLRKETGSLRSRQRSLLRGLGYGGVVVGVLALLAVLFRDHYGPREEARPLPMPSVTTAPPAPPPQVPVAVQGPSPDDRQKAAGLRAKAHAELLQKQWKTCVEDYYDADKLEPLDPQSEKESNHCDDEYTASMNAKPR